MLWRIVVVVVTFVDVVVFVGFVVVVTMTKCFVANVGAVVALFFLVVEIVVVVAVEPGWNTTLESKFLSEKKT